ncbi:MAG: hypothetical protein KKD01_12275 [Proteobacteria bacterium]|nr:hypothetical protein [Pseudomonadota bacterium]MBU1138494.1 hypothetical protein [Pseudomonadota bacterium]MBU1233255.1 hypothetical protein [Pseudomonadota bacterium]MBU1420619.1 hypothetical protein [Pseudomonadota bacterium]MBU1455496.1 hypothetical protein [Pseudomonadota bacterium]
MKKIGTTFTLCLALAASPALAHHPAEDIVDPEIYAMIDEMVSDTPHADLVFDDDMGTSTFITDSVSAAEDLIDDGLLAALSLLDVEDVTATITFGDDVDATSSSADDASDSQWNERNDWGRQVFIEVNTELCTTPPCEDIISD